MCSASNHIQCFMSSAAYANDQCFHCRRMLSPSDFPWRTGYGREVRGVACHECISKIKRTREAWDKCPLCEMPVSKKAKEERIDGDERCEDCRYPNCISCGERSVTVWTPGTYGKREYRCEDCADKWQCRGTCQRRLPADAFFCDASRHRYAVCK